MPEPENPEDRQRRLLAAMLQPAMGAGANPAPPGGVEPPPPPPEPGIRETMPDMLPVRPETGTKADFGTPAAYTHLAPGLRSGPSAIQPVYSGTKDASGMTGESYDQAPTPRLADILTPQEEADRRLAHEPEKKRGAWGAVGDVLKGILFGLSSGQGAIAGGLYGGTGQGRADARKARREEMIGEISRNRGMQQQMRMNELAQLEAQGDIAASQELARWRAAQAQVALTEKPAKYGFGGFDQPMITATDPTTGAIRQYKNEGYTAKPGPIQQPEWVDMPDGSKVAYKRDEAGNPVVWTLPDGSAWRKAAGADKETAGDRDNDVETAAAAWLDSTEGQQAWGSAVEFAQNQRLSTFGVNRSNYQTELTRLEGVISQRLPDPDDDAAAYQNAVKDKQFAQKRADEIRKAVAEGEKAGTEAWKDVAKRRATAGGGGGGGRGGGSFSGVSGYGGGR